MRALRSSGGGGNRSATGAGYERPSRRGFGPLDPDEAWDARVGHEADAYYGYGYEEQELGLRPPQGHSQAQGRAQGQGQADTAYSGAGYSNVKLGAEEQRGRTLNRNPGVGLGVGVDGGGPSAGTSRNPFDDDAAEPSNLSMRGVSPRPIDTSVANSSAAGKAKGGAGAHHDSPTSERRSIFRENV